MRPAPLVLAALLLSSSASAAAPDPLPFLDRLAPPPKDLKEAAAQCGEDAKHPFDAQQVAMKNAERLLNNEMQQVALSPEEALTLSASKVQMTPEQSKLLADIVQMHQKRTGETKKAELAGLATALEAKLTQSDRSYAAEEKDCPREFEGDRIVINEKCVRTALNRRQGMRERAAAEYLKAAGQAWGEMVKEIRTDVSRREELAARAAKEKPIQLRIQAVALHAVDWSLVEDAGRVAKESCEKALQAVSSAGSP